MKRLVVFVFTVAVVTVLAGSGELKAEMVTGGADESSKPLSVMTNSVGMKLVLLPAGEFEMGRPGVGSGPAKPEHRVEITKPFWIGVYEVMQKEYMALGYTNESKFIGPDLPAQNVLWKKAVDFCLNLSEKEGVTYRLPTEAEWEYACRADTGDMYTMGESANHAWYKGNSGKKPHLVGRKKANAWGLHDVYGNVWEWCSDKYSKRYYKKSPLKDPQGPVYGSAHVLRGGAWNSYTYGCSAFYRYRLPIDGYAVVDGDVGFRVVRECK